MYLHQLTHIMKQSVLHLMPALATLPMEDETATNEMDDALPGITKNNIDNFVLAALNCVESAVTPAVFPLYFKQNIVHLPHITQASTDIYYSYKADRDNVYANTESYPYPYSTNCNYRVFYSELHSTLSSGDTILLYDYSNYATLNYSYNNLVFLCTDYLVNTSPVINSNICCKGWLDLNLTDDVCSDNLNLTDTMFFSNGDVYIYTDKIVTINKNSTINIHLTIESSLFGALKLTATDILFETSDGKNLPVSGVVLLTGENASFFIIRFNGNSNFRVAFENMGKTVNWIDIA